MTRVPVYLRVKPILLKQSSAWKVCPLDVTVDATRQCRLKLILMIGGARRTLICARTPHSLYIDHRSGSTTLAPQAPLVLVP
jgi:hypothetical protein